MPGYVQHWKVTNGNITNPANLPIDNTGSGSAYAPPGNRLIAAITVRRGGDVFTAPSNWTEIYAWSDTTFAGAVYERIATGDANDDFDIAYTDAGESSTLVMEFDVGGTTGAALDFAVDTSESTNTSATSVGDGAVGDPGVTPQWLEVAILSLYDIDFWTSDNISAGISYTSGFTNVVYNSAEIALNPLTAMASRVDGGGSSTCVWSTTETGGRAVAGIVLVKITPSGEFPSGYYPERSYTIERDNNVIVDYLDSGAPRQRVISVSQFVTINIEFKYLSLTQKNTLKDWLSTNKGAVVTWTIDGINYSGYIIGSHSEVMLSNTYNVRITYRAQEV